MSRAPVSTPATPLVRIPVTAEERLALSMLAGACAPAASAATSRLLAATLDVLHDLASGRLASARERLADLAGESP